MKKEKISLGPLMKDSFSLGVKSIKEILIANIIYYLPLITIFTVAMILADNQFIGSMPWLEETDGSVENNIKQGMYLAGGFALIYLALILFYFATYPLYIGTISSIVKTKDEKVDKPLKFSWQNAKSKYGKVFLYILLLYAIQMGISMVAMFPIMLIGMVLSLLLGPFGMFPLLIILYAALIYFFIALHFGLLSLIYQEKDVIEALKFGFKISKGRILKFMGGGIVIASPFIILFIAFFAIMVNIQQFSYNPDPSAGIILSSIFFTFLFGILLFLIPIQTAYSYLYHKKLLEVNGEFSDSEIEKSIIDDSYELEMREINRFDE
ncbi:MAG: glycerophosphoryl diester phosphodiesterase membrane domain-containing protein [Spirochaetales bacterium]|nr:glycerophosphoryl diester phosphodiesterase membrane domain-containing protein [Spirochaetales bacterium]